MSTSSPAPPITVGAAITVRRGGDTMPGTVVTLRALAPGRFEVRAQVLTSFGVGISRHVVDGDGREVDSRDGYLDTGRLAGVGRYPARIG